LKEAKTETLAFWIGSAIAFGAWIWHEQGPVKAQEYFAGYMLEQSLSVDNLFVFLLVFNYFKTTIDGQSKVLSYGIGTAVVLRAVLILLGSDLVQVSCY
jgi:predicted tellurium resistance membrane protein TerC